MVIWAGHPLAPWQAAMIPATGRSAPRTVLRLLLAVLVLDLVLIQPNHPHALSWRTLTLFPLELPAILLALITFGQSRAGIFFRVALVAALTTTAALKAADFAMFMSLNRDFNLVADLPLIVSLFQLTVGAFGAFAAALGVLLSAAALIALALALWWACTVWSLVPSPRSIAMTAGLFAVLAGSVAVAEIGSTMRKWTLPVDPPGTAFTGSN